MSAGVRVATTTLEQAIRRVIGFAIGMWQIVASACTAQSAPLMSSPLLVVAVHVAILVLACSLLLRSHRIHPLVVVIAAFGGTIVDIGVSQFAGSPLLFAAVWQLNMIAVLAVFAYPRVFSIVGVLVLGIIAAATVHLTGLIGGDVIVVSIPGTFAAIGVTSFVLAKRIGRYAAIQDDIVLESIQERALLAEESRIAIQSAEDARMVHDTVINTFAAIAVGGAATSDAGLVRQRCERDISTLESLGLGRFDENPSLSIRQRVQMICDVPVDFAGFTAQGEPPWPVFVSAGQRKAISGLIIEVVQNAVKHARATRIEVSCRITGNSCVVDIVDDGIGLDQASSTYADLSAGLGTRAQDHGATARLRTADGGGLAVTISLAPPAPAKKYSAATANKILSTSAWAWGVGVTVIGLCILPLSRHAASHEALIMMLALLATLTVAWLDVRVHKKLTAFAQAFLLAAMPVVFVMSFALVGYGNDDVILWQAIAHTGTPVLLLAHASRRTAFHFALIIHVLTVVVMAWLIWPDDRSLAEVVLVAGVPGLAVMIGWIYFESTIDKFAGETHQIQRNRSQTEARRQSLARLQHLRKRWNDELIQQALSVMDQIVSAELDVSDLHVRRQCGRLERLLRQIALLDPRQVHLAPPLVNALLAADDKNITLLIRSSESDVKDAQDAAAFEEFIKQVIEKAPAQSSLVLSTFSDRGHTRVVVVGSPTIVGVKAARESPWTITQSLLGDQAMIEMTVEVE